MHNRLWLATANISPFRTLNATSSHNLNLRLKVIVPLGFLRTWFLMFSYTLVAILSVSIVLMVKLLGIKLAVEGNDLL